MATLVLTPLNQMTTHLDALIASLVHTNTFAAAPTAANSLVSDDDALTSALATLKQHQQNYARILHLREEAQRLEDELKDVIRKAVRLREEVGRIHPSLLDDEYSSDEEDEDLQQETLPVRAGRGKGRDVDYHTLLNFAARIGKHNSLATREAEREADRRKIEAMKKKDVSSGPAPAQAANTQSMTGAQTTTSPIELSAASDSAQHDHEKDFLELQAQDLDNSHALKLAFPDPMLLRQGALGRLQKIREDAIDAATAREKESGVGMVGEEAVDQEVERLVRQSENVAKGEDGGVDEDEGEDTNMDDGAKEPRREEKRPAAPLPVPVLRTRRESVTQPKQQRQRPVQPPMKRKKLNLDLGADDDDEDDD
jgi:Vitamin-D-receptor interacting Mediator subunit 4